MQGKFRRTREGYLIRDDPYGKEVCVLHLVGHQHFIDAFMAAWKDPAKGVMPEDELFGACNIWSGYKTDQDWHWNR